jgi:hypothetical protein
MFSTIMEISGQLEEEAPSPSTTYHVRESTDLRLLPISPRQINFPPLVEIFQVHAFHSMCRCQDCRLHWFLRKCHCASVTLWFVLSTCQWPFLAGGRVPQSMARARGPALRGKAPYVQGLADWGLGSHYRRAVPNLHPVTDFVRPCVFGYWRSMCEIVSQVDTARRSLFTKCTCLYSQSPNPLSLRSFTVHNTT